MTRERTLVVLLLTVLAAVSCAGRGRAGIDQQADAGLARRLHGSARPLVAGEATLAAALPAAATRWRALRLAAGGATPIDGPLRADELCDERIAVIHQGDADGTWLLDPRTSSAIPCADGAVFCRALPVDGDQRLAVFRCTLSQAGTDPRIELRRLSPDGQDCRMPTWVAGRGAVYEAVAADGSRQLWLADESGAAPLPPAARDARQPHALPDGRLALVVRRDGAWVRCTYDFAAEPVPLAVAPLPAEPRLRPGLRPREDGSVEPVLLRIPERLDLAAALALVEAQDPAVARARALVAVALVEARQSRLARWPTLAVGLFTTPVTGLLVDGDGAYTGDYLAEGLSRGVVGLVQPLLDFGRNAQLEAAALERVQVANDALAEEIQRRRTQAASHALAAEAHRDLAARHAEREARWRERVELAARRAAVGEASATAAADAERGLALASAAVGAERELERFHRAQLLRRCGLDERVAIDVVSGAEAWAGLALPDLDALVLGALIERPRLRAARRELAVAFHVARAGADLRPSLALESQYGQTRDRSFSATDDYLSLGLSGRLPLAAPRAAGLHRERSLALTTALRAAEESESEAVAREVEEAWLALQRARAEHAAAQGEAAAATERLRVVRLRAEQGADAAAAGAEAVAAQRCAQADAAAVAHERGWSVGARLVALLGAAARSHEIAPRLAALAAARAAAARTATWLWRTADIQPGGPALAAVQDAVSRWQLGRVSLFVGGAADPFAEPAARAGLERFAARCGGAGVTLWALLGDPAWFTADDAAVSAELARVAALASGPRALVAGLELDLEPHALAGWADPAQRPALAARWIALVALARRELPAGVPLWLDVPPALLAEFGSELAPHLDGVVAMCYAAAPETVAARAASVATSWPGSYTIAVELTPTEEGAHLAALDDAALRALLDGLRRTHAADPRFAGIALHDLAAMAARTAPAAPSPAPPEIR